MTIDQYDLNRFINAQENIYNQVISELKNGHKQSHWMWFIFPQIDGLGHSEIAKKYAIKSKEEAIAYLNHPILGTRLIECSEMLLTIKSLSVSDIFGYPDDLKFKSSMTLFASVENSSPVFSQALDQYFFDEKDSKTLSILAEF